MKYELFILLKQRKKCQSSIYLAVLVLTFSHFLVGCGSRPAILANVDLRCLCEVELLVGGLLHQVVEGVFKHVLDHVDEVGLEEHALAEELGLAALDQPQSRHRLQLLLVVSAVLVAELHLRVLGGGEGPRQHVEVGWFLVCHVGAHQTCRSLFALVQSLEQILSLQYVMESLKAEVLNQGLCFSIFKGQWCLGLDSY